MFCFGFWLLGFAGGLRGGRRVILKSGFLVVTKSLFWSKAFLVFSSFFLVYPGCGFLDCSFFLWSWAPFWFGCLDVLSLVLVNFSLSGFSGF